jgi:hypothetical protein
MMVISYLTGQRHLESSETALTNAAKQRVEQPIDLLEAKA